MYTWCVTVLNGVHLGCSCNSQHMVVWCCCSGPLDLLTNYFIKTYVWCVCVCCVCLNHVIRCACLLAKWMWSDWIVALCCHAAQCDWMRFGLPRYDSNTRYMKSELKLFHRATEGNMRYVRQPHTHTKLHLHMSVHTHLWSHHFIPNYLPDYLLNRLDEWVYSRPLSFD